MDAQAWPVRFFGLLPDESGHGAVGFIARPDATTNHYSLHDLDEWLASVTAEAEDDE